MINTLSDMDLSGTNADYVSEMMDDKTGGSLPVSTFEIIL